MNRNQVVKRLRDVLGVTQGELAVALGISSKAVQSYEQGWRETPLRVIKQILTLVAMQRADKVQGKACWDLRSCPDKVSSQCLARKLTDGRYCWAVASQVCDRSSGEEEPSVLTCLHCDVVRQFLDDETAR